MGNSISGPSVMSKAHFWVSFEACVSTCPVNPLGDVETVTEITIPLDPLWADLRFTQLFQRVFGTLCPQARERVRHLLARLSPETHVPLLESSILVARGRR
jgi:hypothetical protein